MTSDNMDDGPTREADRHDNLRAIAIAVVAALIVGIASIALMVGRGHPTGSESPTPTPSSSLVVGAPRPVVTIVS